MGVDRLSTGPLNVACLVPKCGRQLPSPAAGPLAPHVSEKLGERLGYEGILATQPWPEWDEEMAREETVVMVLQVNGKVRDRVEVPLDIDEATAEQCALRSHRMQHWLEGGKITRVIVRAPRIVNVVVK